MSHKKYRAETNCLNCGSEVTGHFCPNCGQENLETRENFFHLAFHFVSDYFHFDSKFFRSLILLFTKPGFMTKEYWEGKRVRYIHPLRLYFFITIVFMIAATYFYQHVDPARKTGFVQTTVTLDREDSLAVANDPNMSAKFKAIALAKKEEMKGGVALGMDHFFHDLKYISFFMLPLYAFVFKLLFLRRKNLYVDHLVYTMHLQSFAYVLAGIAFVIATFLDNSLSIIRRVTLVSVFIYVVFSLRYLYHQNWVLTILKSVIATGLIVFLLGLVLGVYVVIYFPQT
jgi:hypothetical protein